MGEIFRKEIFANFANLGQFCENKSSKTFKSLDLRKYIHKNFTGPKKSQNILIKSSLKRLFNSGKFILRNFP